MDIFLYISYWGEKRNLIRNLNVNLITRNMSKQNIGVSVGIIPWFQNGTNTYFLMGHPSNKPQDYWLYMRGMTENWENTKETALREFKEECGVDVSKYADNLVFLGMVKQREGKHVAAYSLEVTSDMEDCLIPFNTNGMVSNMCCGGTIPEIDDYKWMTFEEVVRYTNETNIPFYIDIVKKNTK